LVRAVGFWALAAAIVNVTIGGSIFALPGTLATSMGAAAPLAFTFGALLFVPIVMCFAAAGSRVTATGGPYVYVTTAFGAFPGFAIAVFFWISSVAGSGSMAAALADQISHVFPALGLPLSRASFLLGVYALLFALNARGIKTGVAVILGFAAVKALSLLFLCVAGAAHVQLENLHTVAVPSLPSVGNSLVLVVFAYSGIETALAPSGEVQNPSRVVPRAALAGIAVVIALYIGLQTVAQGVLGKSLAGNNAPLAAVADVLWPGAGRFLVLIATVSLVGVLQGDLLGASRVLYALARDGFLPARLATVTQGHRVPLFAVAMHSGVAWLLASAGSFAALALVSGGAFCLVYIGCCAAAWQLQRQNVGAESTPVRLHGGALIPLTAIAALLGILSTLQRAEWIAMGGVSVAIGCLYAAVLWTRR
jgi:basic amino acid/polyamine antiporter, APA family